MVVNTEIIRPWAVYLHFYDQMPCTFVTLGFVTLDFDHERSKSTH